MTKKHYNWHGGAIIQQHSIIKLNILREYLSRYYQTLSKNPHMEKIALTIVDGFCGGGMYDNEENKTKVSGSPFVCLESTKEAEFLINQNRNKKFKIEADFFFIDKSIEATNSLNYSLNEKGYANRINQDIFIRNAVKPRRSGRGYKA